jgi:hypothetical protein
MFTHNTKRGYKAPEIKILLRDVTMSVRKDGTTIVFSTR